MSSTTLAKATPFCCPGCRKALRLAIEDDRSVCSACGWTARAGDGAALNFVMDPALRKEADHYEDEYAQARLAAPVELEALAALWKDNPWAPFNQTIHDALGDVRNKTMVLLGNGVSAKELFFLTQGPRALVYSDLSTAAVRAARDHYPQVAARDDAFFAAIDAQDLPFADASVGVIYGYAFVHHLPDLDRFLAEVARVLEPGGRAVFMDNSYSPLWQRAKHGWLNRAMRVSHEVDPISAEDMRYTLSGGFRSEDIKARAAAVGLDAWFEPTGTVHYLITRASQIFAGRVPVLNLDRRTWALQPSGSHELVVGSRRLLEAISRVDRWLERYEVFRSNRMRLVWGLTTSEGRGDRQG